MITLVRRQLGLGVPLGCLGSVTAAAQDRPVPQVPLSPEATLAPVLVTAPPPLASSSEQLIPGKDFELRPQGRPADVLRLIPGLIINQHQGGGKAEQYLIRGFSRRPAPTSPRTCAWRSRLRGENLTNTDWREAQFFFTSRLPGEPAGGVPDIHFTPGTPRSFLGGLAVHF